MSEVLVEAVAAWRVAYDKIAEYETILKPLVDDELRLRKAVVSAAFSDGQENHEGTTSLEIWPGWVLKTVVKIDRKVDEAALTIVTEQLQKMLINTDSLIRRKPELVVKMYRLLNEEQRKIFDQCLIVKPGSPLLQLVQKTT